MGIRVGYERAARAKGLKFVKSIAYILKVKGVTGVERHVRDLCREFARDFKVYAFVLEKPDRPEDEYCRSLEACGVTVYRFPVWKNFNRVALKGIRKQVIQHQIDIVHTHLMAGDIYGYFLRRKFADLVWLTSMHNVHSFTGMKTAVRWLYKHLLRKADRVIYIAEFMREHLQPLIKARSASVIYHSVPDPGEAIGSGDPNEILFVGRLIHLKGCDDLLRSFALVKAGSPEAFLTIVGDGPERSNLEKQAQELNLGSSVRFAGFQNDTASFFARAGIFVLPSRSEGLVLTLLEAMAHGKAIVASRITSVPECIVDGESGLLTRPGDIYDFASALGQLLTDGHLRLCLGQAAREAYLKTFTTTRMITEYRRLYDSML
jgi:glycosyltransferase involved in cell wall biosynthesis